MKTFSVKVYIIHASFMDIRKKHIQELADTLKKCMTIQFDIEYIEGAEPNSIDANSIKNKVLLSKDKKDEFFDSLIHNMHINQISNALKHGKALELAASIAENFDFFLILEDDVLNGNDLVEKLQTVCEMLSLPSEDADILYLGFPSLQPIQNKDGLIIQNVSEFYKLNPCCDSYIIKSSAISKIQQHYYPIRFITNFHLTYIAKMNDLKSKMVIPNLFLDGSKYGAYLSTLDPNNKLIFNPDFIELTNKLKSLKPGDEKEIKLAFETIKFKNHPDVLHLNALFLMSQGEYLKAKEILQNVYDITTQNGCIVNNETDFLKTFMRLYKFIQD